MKLSYRRVNLRGSGIGEEQFDRVLDYLWDASRTGALGAYGEWRPPVDVCQTEKEVRVLVELAGMREDDIEVTLFEDVILITGEREASAPTGDGLTYHEAGIRYGRFRVEVFLPSTVEPDRVQAVYENGFLRIDLPKRLVSIQPRDRATGS